MKNFSFQILHRDRRSWARAGIYKTPHGEIKTPAFITVGTQGSVKAVSPDDLKDIGVQVIIANTYHLHLRPGEDLIWKMGSLHEFMGWDGPLMTDSGGFQIFSLGAGREQGVGKIASIFPEEADRGGHLRPAAKEKSIIKVDEDGVQFRSYIDGSKHKLTPELAVEIQRKLGADIILALDECTSPLHDYEYTKKAMERTHRWAVRALEEYDKNTMGKQALFGIVQGGFWRDLREESAKFIASLDFAGLAIGGSLGKSKQDMYQVLEWTIPILPEHKIRHLLGIGEIADIFAVVERGIDLFDCVAPTRLARTGTLFAKSEKDFRLNIFNSRFKDDPRPIEENCACYTCRNFSRAYLQHLFIAGELLAYRLATIHNLRFMEALMEEIHGAIAKGSFAKLKETWLSWPSNSHKSDI